MLIDIYVLAPERSAATIERFLLQFLPHREPSESDYAVRLGSNEPTRLFGTPEELTAFCELHPSADARAYWNNRSAGDPRSAHAYFLPDGGLVLGLSIATRDEAVWARWLEELRSAVGAVHGYWTVECPPADTIGEFIRWNKRRA